MAADYTQPGPWEYALVRPAGDVTAHSCTGSGAETYCRTWQLEAALSGQATARVRLRQRDFGKNGLNGVVATSVADSCNRALQHSASHWCWYSGFQPSFFGCRSRPQR